MGETFGRYELLDRIGVGGMAEVYRARVFGPEGFVKEVVIKRILPAFNADPDFVAMFVNEARIAAKLQHANIVNVFDFSQVAGVYYIAMEWVEGCDLRRLLIRSRSRAMPLPPRITIHVGVEVAKGLHYAHTRVDRGRPLNLVHRDISPHNLLVSCSGEVKITDFGIAKVAALAAATHSGMLKGKLGYMSPEQASGRDLDGRSDLYSLGIVLWEMLTGRRLFRASSEAELFSRVKQAHVPPPRSVGVELQEELEAVVLRMLAPRIDERYQTAEELLRDLEQFARAGDALEVAGMVRRLVPDAARSSLRGETEEIEPAMGEVAVAAPDAPTRTAAARREDLGTPANSATDTIADPSKRGSALAGDASSWLSRQTVVVVACVFACLTLVAVGALLLAREQPGGTDDVVRAPLRTAEPAVHRVVAQNPQPLAPKATQVRAAKGAAADAGDTARVLVTDGDRNWRKKRRPPTTGRVSRSTARGTLSLIVSPWARVKIDGRDAGLTPVLGYHLTVGRHRVALENPEINRREVLTVRVKRGAHHEIRRFWDK